MTMPLSSICGPTSWPGAEPSRDRSRTPNAEPYCVAAETSRAMPAIGWLNAPAALATAGTLIATVPTGAVGAPPFGGKVIVVDAAGLPPAVAIGVPFAAMYTFQV